MCGRPRATHAIGRTVELNYQGHAYSLDVGQIGPHSYRIAVDGVDLVIDVDRLGEFESRLTLGDARFQQPDLFKQLRSRVADQLGDC